MGDNNHVPMLSTKSLIGTDVVNLQDEKLGKLEEIMIDLATGRVGYAVLSFGGILGLGDKLFAVPWASLTVDEEREVIVMDAHKDRLAKAPGFDKNNWPQTPNGVWVRDVYSYYGHEPYWTQVP
jgi:sporulation protein YlmC with PRC-barrel domain